MKKGSLIALIIALVIVVAFVGYAWCLKIPHPTSSPTERKTITIVDSAKRTVKLPWPLKRVAALSGYSSMALVALGAKDTIVGIDMYHINEPWAPNAPNIGSCFEPNIEAILATKPDVVITYVKWPPPEALEKKLEPLGIKVARLDLYFINTLFSEMRLLGRLVNKEKEANRLIKYWEEQLNLIKERMKKLKPQEQVKVYWESYFDYSTVGPGSSSHEDIMLAGGINVFAESSVPYPKVSPEAVVQKNPDIIVKHQYMKSLEETRRDITKRSGWNLIKAVKKNKIYIIPYVKTYPQCSAFRGVFGRIVELAYLVKIFYPELSRDFDPSVLHRHWLEQLGIKPKGIWIYPPLK